jgi:hypothetical protein
MDYAAWLARLERFVRAAARLPGEYSMQVDIAPPLGKDASLPATIPPGLSEFYRTAAGRVTCSYRWSPDARRSGNFEDSFPDRYSVYGGLEVTPIENYGELEEQLRNISEIFDDDDTAPDPHGYNKAAAHVLRHSAPLWNLGTGDMIVECPQGCCGDATILFVAMELAQLGEKPLVGLSRSFDEFLTAWESVAYLAPELYLLQPFIEDSEDRLLNADSPLARHWHRFIYGLVEI